MGHKEHKGSPRKSPVAAAALSLCSVPLCVPTKGHCFLAFRKDRELARSSPARHAAVRLPGSPVVALTW